MALGEKVRQTHSNLPSQKEERAKYLILETLFPYSQLCFTLPYLTLRLLTLLYALSQLQSISIIQSFMNSTHLLLVATLSSFLFISFPSPYTLLFTSHHFICKLHNLTSRITTTSGFALVRHYPPRPCLRLYPLFQTCPLSFVLYFYKYLQDNSKQKMITINDNKK